MIKPDRYGERKAEGRNATVATNENEMRSQPRERGGGAGQETDTQKTDRLACERHKKNCDGECYAVQRGRKNKKKEEKRRERIS